MPEKTKKVKPIEVDYTCDVCHNGEMRHNGFPILSDPPQYPHYCTKCYAEKIFPQIYPYIKYELE